MTSNTDHIGSQLSSDSQVELLLWTQDTSRPLPVDVRDSCPWNCSGDRQGLALATALALSLIPALCEYPDGSQASGDLAAHVLPRISHRSLCWAHRYTEGIQRMLDHYHLLINTLNEAETALLEDHSQELLRVFRSGYKRLNWNSLGNHAAPGHLTVCFTCISCVCCVHVEARGWCQGGVSYFSGGLPFGLAWLASKLRSCLSLPTVLGL